MPKRSTGCYACRERKVKCDEAKPSCNTCTRRSVKCPGYRPEKTFILYNYDAGVERTENLGEAGNSAQSTNGSEDSDGHGQMNLVVMSERRPELVTAAVPRQVSSRAANRAQFLNSFMSAFLPADKFEALTPPSAIIFNLPSATSRREALPSAIDAVCAAQLASTYRDAPLVHRSRSLYGTALSQLIKSLSVRDATNDDETLLATYLLGIFEIYLGNSGGTGFLSHTQGILQLLNSRGPVTIKSKLALLVFNGTRYNSFCIGLVGRKAIFLDEADWLQVTSEISKTDPWVALMDIAIEVPRLLESSDKLSAPTVPSKQVEAVLLKFLTLEQRMLTWLSAFHRNGLRYKIVDLDSIDMFTDMCNDKTYKTAFSFPSYATANTYILCWTTMLVLKCNRSNINQKLHPMTTAQRSDLEQELYMYATLICQSIPFSCQPSAGSTGRFGTMLPLRFAREYFLSRGHSAEAAWCMKTYYGTRIRGLYQPSIPISAFPKDL
ncbi:hypothetical protein K432DRAFT_304821 [Lepidopterella palustris CBS 459.81]|uniref:Zn(2)-C6 fungal-type domain-containing protein n=1 Tax=Lepidopterella palustris CBS 459.81 TaxID=1314670 RepID=A0A8E2E4B2_9PEZI|nr:hypothetical protein K432DRAFT_304821 [Lepidopterella palustris CBS 459.81]